MLSKMSAGNDLPYIIIVGFTARTETISTEVEIG